MSREGEREREYSITYTKNSSKFFINGKERRKLLCILIHLKKIQTLLSVYIIRSSGKYYYCILFSLALSSNTFRALFLIYVSGFFRCRDTYSFVWARRVLFFQFIVGWWLCKYWLCTVRYALWNIYTHSQIKYGSHTSTHMCVEEPEQQTFWLKKTGIRRHMNEQNKPNDDSWIEFFTIKMKKYIKYNKTNNNNNMYSYDRAKHSLHVYSVYGWMYGMIGQNDECMKPEH